MIAKLLTKLLKRYKVHLLVRELLDKEQVSLCERKVTNNGGHFYPEANVENLRSDSRAIIIGNNSHIRGELLVWKHGGVISIGSNCFVGANSKIWSGNDQGVSIGSNVLISHNVSIIDSDSHEIDHIQRAKGFEHLTKYGHPETNISVRTSPIIIEDNVWISHNVCILKGVTIGESSIIGAGSVVTKNIPSFSIVAGNPGVVIKKLN
jgi:acetyltransferase-like isoleucine patch superfamily enzyme